MLEFIIASSAHYRGRQDRKKSEFISTVATHFKELTICIGLFSGATISFYLILLYMPTFAITQLDLPLSDALIAQSVGLAFQAQAVLPSRSVIGAEPNSVAGDRARFMDARYVWVALCDAHPLFEEAQRNLRSTPTR